MFLMWNPYDFEKPWWIPVYILKVCVAEPAYINLNTKKYLIKHSEGGRNQNEFVRLWCGLLWYFVCANHPF